LTIQAVITKTFRDLGISEDLVPYALPAMDKQSQNDNLFKRSKARKMTPMELKNSDKILSWIGLPFTTSTTIEEFIKIVEIN